MKQLFALLSLCLLLLPGTLRALPVYEPFNYAPGSILYGQTPDGILIWAAAGAAGAQISNQVGSVTYPGLPPSVGNSIGLQNIAGPAGRLPIGGSVNSGTIYYSFLFQAKDITALTASGGFFAGFNDSVGASGSAITIIGTRVLTRASGAGFNIGLVKNNSTAANFVWDPRVFNINETILIVGSYTFITGTDNDRSDLWINPPSLTFGAGVAPASHLTNFSLADLASVQSFCFFERATLQPKLAICDELRVGSTWASVTPPAPLSITCPADFSVIATSGAGAIVNYTATASGGCNSPAANCIPPSGSNFPMGTTTVNCTANSACGQTAACSFKVTVNPQPPEVRTTSPDVPPADGVYISPDQWHQLYANGIIISNIAHERFTQSHPPPSPGGTIDHVFGSGVEFEQPNSGGGPVVVPVGSRVFAPATVHVRVTDAGPLPGGGRTFDTEMLQLDVSGGGLPPGVMIRESPTRASTGKTTIRQSADGAFLISSFFDIFTEMTLDGGATWSPSQGPAHMELHTDPRTIPTIPAPTPILPPRNDKYISPTEYHALAASGIIIKDISHKFFTQSQPPPAPGTPAVTETFDSQIDYQVSTDGGATFTHGRSASPVSVSVRHRATDGTIQVFDTEMLSLNLQGGGLPVGVMVRESPTKRSQGGTAIEMNSDGTARIGSFFDIFTEMSVDGGASWTPSAEPVRVTLVCDAPETPFPSPNLPPPASEYISPERWHQLYANGIIISNVSHKRFTQSTPPPPPGGTQVHHFDSQIEADVSQNGGATFTHVSGPASVDVQVRSVGDFGSTRYFDTEMLSLNFTLPGGVMIRESPSKASLGRTSIRMVNDPATGIWDYISSFFDIFTEISLDGGANWSPSVSGPAEMVAGPIIPPLSITCSPDITTTTTSPAGAAVIYNTSASGGCDPKPTLVCNPPSGSTFPIGTTVVTCTASDSCGHSATCSFNVTVNRLPPPQIFFPGNPPILPPPTGVYISPGLFHQLAAQGIIIKDIRHRRFTQGQPPPPAGGVQTHQFGSMVDMQVSTDGGNTYQPVSAPAQVAVRVTNIGSQGNDTAFDTEMLQLDVMGPGFMIRESPTRASTGKTTIRQVPGGNLIGSFFDVFTELSLDGGATWTPTQEPATVELRRDAALVPAVPASTPVLPPRNDAYVSPAQYQAQYGQGIIIRDIRNSLFSRSLPPAAPGGVPEVRVFDSQVDVDVSIDGGNTFKPVRASAAMRVRLENLGSSGQDGVGDYDTEMLEIILEADLDGDGQYEFRLRESPSLPSRGGTEITRAADGTYRIGSFFDIFTELSVDGGATWMPVQNGPAHMELICDAPPQPFPSPLLPPPTGEYISPEKWHAYYAMGIVISNASHKRFTQSQPPPPPGVSQTHSFSSTVLFQYSGDGGATFQQMSAPATCSVRVDSTADDYGDTRFFNTEMLALNIQGGTLPAGVMVRESPSKASLGRTSIQSMPDGSFRIGSFFDIFTEVSLDGGNTWIEMLGRPGHMVVTVPGLPPISITCPADITTTATSPAGAAVAYPPPTTAGGCSALTVICNPPSPSVFPIGTTVVTCTASDTCGQSATCTFKVTVNRPPTPEVFFPGGPTLPPPTGVYISPDLYHQLAAQGIIIKDIRHRRFTQSQPPPPPGGVQVHQFGSVVDMQVSTDGGASFQPASAPAQVSVRVATGDIDADGRRSYDTEMLQLNVSGGGLPAGVMVRESPSKASLGKTTVRQVPGGNMIGSFFDIFTEISVDGGQTWTPVQDSQHVELRRDPALVPPVPASTPLLPPRNDAYISPAQYHQLYAAGIVIKDVRHSFFTDSQPPPAPGQSQTHQFGSQLDMLVSTDGGNTFRAVRLSADVSVRVDGLGGGTFDTEMLSLVVHGDPDFDLLRIRESPTLPSRGGTQIDQVSDGTFRIGSFFDIFTEVSLDGGNTWSAAQSGPARVELICDAPPQPQPTPNLPPPNGEYISPQKWHALYAQGIVISNVSHKRFTQSQPPPPPGGSQTHSFSSDVTFLYRAPGSANFQQVTAPAQCLVRVDSTADDYGDTRFFDTEMLSLNIQGGGLPAGVMVRESPSKASLGRTSIRMVNDPATGIWDYISSFFDIFTEVSLDGGNTWSPSVSLPAHMVLSPPLPTFSISCPADITTTATGPAGAVVNYTVLTFGGCDPVPGSPPPTLTCNPPSGSTFPIGTTTVTCTATDPCNQTATCSFTVTVKPKPVPEIFFPGNVLPPPTGLYISPALYHQLYANGIIIRDIRHKRFTQSQPPPPPGGSQVHSFGSIIEAEVSTDGGVSYFPASGTADCSVRVTSAGNDGDKQLYDTEMLALNLHLPGGVMLRESPTLVSLGKTSVRQVPGGYMIGSFFDIFTELSLDNGANWSPAQEAGHVELRKDPELAVSPITVPSNLLPPPNDYYISPARYHALYAQGIIIKDVRHKFFTDSQHPPGAGQSQTHTFDSQVDFNMSSDGGITFHPGRAPAAVEVSVANLGSSGEDGIFDTEMMQLNVGGGDLPAGVMLRESPTLRSMGGTKIQRLSDGTYQINSFFDVFTELTTDGGQNWTIDTAGPTTVALVCNAPEQTEPSNNLPPEQGQYVSPDQWHALFANGIIISNVSHLRFTSSEPPPPPGGSSTHQFGSTVQFQISMNGGQTWSIGSAPANVVTKVVPKIDNFYPNGGSLRYFDTEMLSLNLQGGTLPGNIRLRESPSKASLGRTSIRQSGGGGVVNPPYHISSFFDVFTEISTDAGNTWSPSLTLPPSMALLNCTGPANLSITLSADGTTATISWTGTGFRLQCTEKLEEPTTTQWQNIGGVSPVTVDVVPGKSRFYRVLCP